MKEKNFTVDRKKPTLHLGGELPADIVETFRRQCEERHQQKYGALAAAIRLWTDLPVEVQAKILDGSMDTPALFELVQKVVDERIEAGRRAGEKLAKRQKRRPP